jgi:cation diffusion facilitator family transporter
LAEAKKGIWLGIAGNLFLALMKGVVGWWAGSRALLADAANSATDVVSSLAVLYGIHLSHAPPDEEHPYGHGKAENIVSVIVAVLVAGVGLEAGVQAVKAFFQQPTPPGWPALVAAILSMVVKEGMFRYTIRLGKKWKSQAIITSAWDHRADVVSTLAALVGVAGAMLGPVVGIPALVYLDPLAGIVVVVFVLSVAAKLIRESMRSAMDRVLDAEETEELRKAAEEVAGVLRIDELLAREHGHYVIVDIRVAVDPAITVEEGHSIGKRVKQRLLERFDHVSGVFVHINPYERC